MCLIKSLIQPAVLILVGLGSLTMGQANAQTACNSSSVSPLLWMPAMNVFRRFAGESEPMYRFYTEVLGFEALTTYDVGNNTQVWRIKAGPSELKLSRRDETRTYVSGGVTGATGLRLWSFFYSESDETVLSDRFRRAGLPLPRFSDLSTPGQHERRAIVADPDGHSVELVVTSDTPGIQYEKIELGVVVSNLVESIAFYRDFVGLEELGSTYDPVFNTTKHVFRHGSTRVSLRTFDTVLPADTGSSGIQYVVTDVERVDELARCHDVKIATPLGTIPGFTVRTIWLDDPDGTTNYFADTEESRGES